MQQGPQQIWKTGNNNNNNNNNTNVFEIDKSACIGRNFRFAAYRSLFFWLYKKKGKKGGEFRFALPSCLVSLVRQKYPEDDQNSYTGFIPRPLPGRIIDFESITGCHTIFFLNKYINLLEFTE